ncbi:YciI family protein [Ekhidna sp. To15]|uniref:YciI family protein n=1 Tax=Ekhidna sp. To15 TaxID=3395267 RepID=UPI003F528464
MKEYLILIAAQNERALSQAEEQHCIQEYGKWAETLSEKHITARRLSLEPGDLIPRKKSVTTDGPFVEAKELIAGFVLISANSKEEAREIASTCPLNEYFHLFVKETN